MILGSDVCQGLTIKINLASAMKAVNLSLVILIIYSQAATATPFFWKRPENYKKMVQDRTILVSADTGEKPPLKTMSVDGAGIVSAPLDFTYSTVKKFDELPKVSERFEEAKFNPKDNTLDLHISALGYHVKMKLLLTFEEKPKTKIIHWKSIEGGFVGMSGDLQLVAFDARRTEMSLSAYFENEKLPLPKVLMGLGLEVVTQRVAGVMREYIEAKYKK
jgi:uncharacterized membrane protein